MCRIFAAVISSGDVAPTLKIGLKRLEYGGYDSSGMATIADNNIIIRKGVGKLDEVDSMVHFDQMKGRIGIAHNRWATHGYPTTINAHPQVDCSSRIAVVHNGIIENYMELKDELIDQGHTFRSRTDTEVIAHLIERSLNAGDDFVTATIKSSKELRGSFAVAALYNGEPNKIVVIKQESPLLLGIGDGMNFAASDATAFIDKTDLIIPLEDGDLAVIDNLGYKILRIDSGKVVNRDFVKLSMKVEDISKGIYSHYMLKEIMEQPLSLRYTLELQSVYLDVITELMDRSRTVYLVGSGTSYNSCLAGSYIYSKIGAFPTIPALASEFGEQYGRALDVDSSLILVSQSGETADVLKVASLARMRASTVLGITNVVGSTLTRITRAYIIQQAGPEIGVAATKTYTSQLLTHLKLALNIGRKRGKLSQSEMDDYNTAFELLPKLTEKILKGVYNSTKELAENLSGTNHIFFMGRGMNTATAYEGRLKLLEISYMIATAYSAGESKHGPIALIEKGVPVIFVVPSDETRKTMISNIMEIKARNGKIIVIGQDDDKELMEISDKFIPLPSMPDIITPIGYILPLQLFAYHMALVKGLDPDKPRNLAKSVTVQ
ncbi:MAG: glutamine--fructose-6-phosphate transaminase (isomerizing) [Nitrososphaerota archaeon]|jgi:glucosamine--fructose-6-phosphate aminotransferase (isomerizing)|nr:glutamine--fructose-6-phosphate transaminase (isomerizing) [Nitrososphaerota archaeon]